MCREAVLRAPQESQAVPATHRDPKHDRRIANAVPVPTRHNHRPPPRSSKLFRQARLQDARHTGGQQTHMRSGSRYAYLLRAACCGIPCTVRSLVLLAQSSHPMPPPPPLLLWPRVVPTAPYHSISLLSLSLCRTRTATATGTPAPCTRAPTRCRPVRGPPVVSCFGSWSLCCHVTRAV